MKKKKPNTLPMKVKKPKQPKDATRRNVQAANKKFATINDRLETIESVLRDVWAVGEKVEALERQMAELLNPSGVPPVPPNPEVEA